VTISASNAYDYPALRQIKASDFEVCLLLFTEGECVASYVPLVTAYDIKSCEQSG